jgi:hypothetical protein
MFDEMKKPLGRNLALYPPRGMAHVAWSRRWATHQFFFNIFSWNTSNGGMKGPIGLIQERMSQGIPVLRIEEKLSDACLSMLRLSCVCAVQFWCWFRRSWKVLQDCVEWCPLRVRRFKKTKLLIQEWNPSLLRVKKPPGVLTEICGWWRRKFFNHFLPAFSFLMQNQF